MAGNMDILPKSNDSGLQFVKRYGMLDEGFSSSFGFNEEEVRAVAGKIFSPSTDSDKELLIQNINSWYKGYVRPFASEKQLFKPSSVIMYLKKCSKYNKIAEF